MRLVFLGLTFLLSACSITPVLNSPLTSTALSNASLLNSQANSPQIGAPEGFASWYGPKFAGRKTANGETFDPSQLTAAHPNLPFGTYVRVTNLNNNQTVTVRINDRGPFKAGRIIDLSKQAAESIGMIGSGIAQVRLELIDPNAQTNPADTQTITASASASNTVNSGYRLATEQSLTGFDVISAHYPVGQLLAFSGTGQPLIMRVISNTMPSQSGVDFFVSPEAINLLGEQIALLN